MGDVVVLNLVFFFPAVLGAAAFTAWVLRILRTPAEPGKGPRLADGDDLARSA